MRLSRLLAIITLLLNNDKMTAKQLATRFEVTERTIIRDMNVINEAGIPVISYQGYEGGYGVYEGYKLDHSILTGDEIDVLLSSMRGIDKAMSNAHMKNVIAKLENLTSVQTDDTFLVDFNSWDSEFDKRIYGDFNNAILKRNNIRITYAGVNGEKTVRVVEPHLLGIKQGYWYLYAYCVNKEAFRLFKANRIMDYTCLKDSFERKPFNNEDVFGVFDPKEEMIDAVIEFDSSVRGLIYDLIPRAKLIETDEGRLRFEARLTFGPWLRTELLKFGSKCEVIKPQALIDILKEEAEAMLKSYKK